MYSDFLHKITSWQYELNRFISSHIREIQDEASITATLTIIGVAFLYGLIHATGPGHGKALVAFYFTSNKSDYKKAFKMGYLISVFHAFSALIFTFGIYFILEKMFRKNFNEFSSIAMSISAVMIILVGLYLVYEAYMGRKDKEKKIKKSNKSEVAVAFSAGIVPCPGVMTIVLFCIILGQYTLGILSAVAMSIGMGLTISLAGIFSIAINKKAGNFLNSYGFILEMLGAFLVLCLGSFLLLAQIL
ncbi:MAG: high frequency lysogenization protein HflD [Campylobacterota bacterium]|nr:high frequency lysogenization protein HflD [Campylobacterota bacterium]